MEGVMPKWLQLMRTGEFTDRNNKKFSVTADNLNEIQKNYNREFPAHLVVGHPDRPTVPSFGIVDKLKVVGDRLLFQPASVVAEFAKLVARGGFPAVSAGVDLVANKLDHIAFLSAAAPAIAGLEPIAEFSSPAAGAPITQVDVSTDLLADRAEFSVPSYYIGSRFRGIGSMFRRLRDYLIEKSDAESADRILPDYLITELSDDPPADADTIAQFSSGGGEMDPVLKEQLDAANVKVNELTGKLAEFQASAATLQQTNAALADQVKQLTTQIAALAGEKQLAEFSVFVENLIAAKKVLPGEKESLVKELAVMAKASNLAEFSQGDATATPLAIFRAKLEARPATVPGNEHTAHRRDAEFSQGESDPVQVGLRARNYVDEQAARGITVSARDAVAAVSKQ